MIRLIDANKKYAEKTQAEILALNHVNFSINAGEFLAVQGPSGCGKSTLLNIIGLLDSLSSGQYFLDGQDVARIREKDQAKLRNEMIGFVVQDFALIGNETALFNVGLPMLINNAPHRKIRNKSIELLEQLGVAEQANKLVRNMSGGQRQRVAIARALVNSPSIILADEPTGALDQKTAIEVMNLLCELNRKMNLTVLLVTHDDHVSSFANRHLFMVDGNFVSNDSQTNQA